MRQTEFLSFWVIFCPLTPVTTRKIINFEKMKTASGEVIILHVHQKSQSYDVCLLRYGVQQTEFFVILGHFLPTNNLKNKNFEKMKKTPEDIII